MSVAKARGGICPHHEPKLPSSVIGSKTGFARKVCPPGPTEHWLRNDIKNYKWARNPNWIYLKQYDVIDPAGSSPYSLGIKLLVIVR